MNFRILGHGIPYLGHRILCFSKLETAFLKKKKFPDGNLPFRVLHYFLPWLRQQKINFY